MLKEKIVIDWRPPSEGFFRLDVEGAIFLDHNKAGAGVILRDHKGEPILVASILENKVQNPKTIEVVAILKSHPAMPPLRYA